MPHPEQEHALMIEVARLRKERDEALSREARLAAANKALAADVTRCAGIESALAAARLECEARNSELYEQGEELSATRRALYAESEALEKLRVALRKIDPIDVSVLDAATDKRQSVDWARVAKWMQETARAALAAPGDGEEGKR